MRTFLVTLSLAVLLQSPSIAEDEKVSLRKAVELALVNNHLVKSAAYEHKAAEKAITSSRSYYYPHVYLQETVTAANTPTNVFMMKLDQGRFSQNDFEIPRLNNPQSTTDFRTAAVVEMPFLDFTIGTNVEISKHEEGVKRFEFERQKEDVAFQVFAAYVEVQKANAFIAVADKQVADAREHMRLATVRNQEGVGLRSDVLRARTFLSEMEQQQISAGNNLRLAMLRLALVTGNPGRSLDAFDEIHSSEMVLGHDELVKLAVENRQDLKAMERNVEKADSGVKLARNAFLPTVHGSASYQMNDKDMPFGRDNDSWMVGATLRWDAFDGFRRSSERERARALKSSAEEYLDRYREEVTYQVTESYLRRDEAGKRLEISRHSVLESEEGLRLVEKRYENSISTLVELLDAQTAVNRARANLIETETGFALATARLYHAAGILLKEVLQ